MAGKWPSYCVSGDIPDPLRRNFEAPGLGLVIGSITKVDRLKGFFWVRVRYVPGRPTYKLQVAPEDLPRNDYGYVFLTGQKNVGTLSAVLVTSEDSVGDVATS